MRTLKDIQAVLSKERISTYLTHSVSASDLIFFEEENAVGSVLKFSLLTGASEQTQIALETVANDSTYPAGTIMQVINMGVADLSGVLNEYNAARDRAPAGDISAQISREGTKERARFLASRTRAPLVSTSEVRMVDSQGYWTIKVPLKTFFSAAMLNSEQERNLQAEITEFTTLRERLQAQLSVASIHSEVIDHTDVMALLRRYFDPYGPQDRSYDDMKMLNEQIMPPGSRLSWMDRAQSMLRFTGFSQSRDDGVRCAILSTHTYPRIHSLGGMFSVLGDPRGSGPQVGMPYALCTSIHYPDAMSKEGAIRRKQIAVDRQAVGPMLRWSEMLREKDRAFKLIAKALNDGAQPVEVATSLVIWNRRASALNRATSRLASYLKTLGWTMRQERFVTNVTFFNQLPLSPSPESIKNTHRWATMTGTHAAQLLPVIDEWQGRGHAVLMNTRRGRVFGLDVFHHQNKNYNWMVVAEAGAGKSYVVQRLTQDYRSLDVKIWIIDTGRSHQKTAKQCGGQVIQFTRDSKVSLNPFTHVQDINDELSILVACLAKMASPDAPMDNPDLVRIAEAIKSAYTTNGSAMEIRDVISYLSNQTGPSDPTGRCIELARLLAPYGPVGAYGSWFKGANTFSADAGLTVLELADLEANKPLQNVVLMQLVIAIKQEMYTARDGRKRMLIVEEGGDRVKDPAFANFLSEAYAKVRKEVGSIGLVLQNLDQLYSSPFGGTIAANCDTRLIMNQKGETIARAVRNGWMELDGYTESIVRDVHTVKGQYSEMAVLTSNGAGIARLVESPFNRVLFSSEGEDFHAVLKAAEQGEDITKLVRERALKYENVERD